MDRDLMLSLYRDMICIRRFEEEAARSYTRGKIGGFLHLYIGEEVRGQWSPCGSRSPDPPATRTTSD